MLCVRASPPAYRAASVTIAASPARSLAAGPDARVCPAHAPELGAYMGTSCRLPCAHCRASRLGCVSDASGEPPMRRSIARGRRLTHDVTGEAATGAWECSSRTASDRRRAKRCLVAADYKQAPTQRVPLQPTTAACSPPQRPPELHARCGLHCAAPAMQWAAIETHSLRKPSGKSLATQSRPKSRSTGGIKS